MENHGGIYNIDRRKAEELGEKRVPVLLFPQIPHGLTRQRTRVSVAIGRLLTA
jgi:hypothetical protein